MRWFAIYKLSDGSHVSSESDAAQQRNTDEQLAALGLGRVEISQHPDGNNVWDPSTKTLKLWVNRPLAVIVTKHAGGDIDTIFDVGEPITIEVDIKIPDGSILYTAFEGSFVVPVDGPGNKTIPIKFTFSSGVASKVITLNEAGVYSVDQGSSDLVKINPFLIQVTL